MNSRRGTFIALALTLPISIPTTSAETYRWTDDKGEVHYSDQVPPDQIKNRRSKLSAQGFEVDVVEAPKTAEQREREQLLKKLRDQQERVLNEQRELDRALMHTYHSTDEILDALKAKLDGYDKSIALANDTIQRQTELLAKKTKVVQELERSGKPVPQGSRNSVTAQEQRLGTFTKQREKLENEKRATADRFERDIKRFKSIMAMQGRNEGLTGDWTKSVVLAETNSRDNIVISAIDCEETAVCEKLWNLTRDYIHNTTGYPIPVETDKILQTPYPLNDTDFGVTATRMEGDPKDIIFIDVLCRPTVTGEHLCRSGKIHDFLINFRTSLQQQAGIAPTTSATHKHH